MATWRRAREERSPRRGRQSNSGRRRAEPIPEHGASTRTRSNVPSTDGRVASCATTRTATPSRSAVLVTSAARSGRRSRGDDASRLAHDARHVRRLPAGRGTDVEHSVTRLRIEGCRRRTRTPGPARRTNLVRTRGAGSGPRRRAGRSRDGAARDAGCARSLGVRGRTPRRWSRTCSSRGSGDPRSPKASAATSASSSPRMRRSSRTAHGDMPVRMEMASSVGTRAAGGEGRRRASGGSRSRTRARGGREVDRADTAACRGIRMNSNWYAPSVSAARAPGLIRATDREARRPIARSNPGMCRSVPSASSVASAPVARRQARALEECGQNPRGVRVLVGDTTHRFDRDRPRRGHDPEPLAARS